MLNLAAYIDHTILAPQTQRADIDRICAEALQYHFAAVCVPPCYVKRAAKLLKNSTVQTATVIGFPLGYSTRSVKLYEMNDAISHGAQEIDFVINIGALKDRRWHFLQREIKALSAEAHRQRTKIKVIIETALLTTDEVVTICDICAECKVDFVKTSTGFSTAGAVVETVALMRQTLPPTIAIKASGGIRTRAFAEQLIAAGATRLGCSSSIAIVGELNE